MDQESSLSLTPEERRAASILVVGNGLEVTVKQLLGLKFLQIRKSLFHNAALRLLIDEEFSHVIYSTQETDLPANLFTEKARRLKHRPILIAASAQPEPDTVCEMLLAGARAFFVLSATSDMLDLVIGEATKGQPITAAILQSPKRNETLLRALLDDIDELAHNLRTSKRRGTELPPVEPLLEKIRLSASTLRLFSRGGSVGLVKTLVEIGEMLGPRGSPRVSRLRRELLKQRGKSAHTEDTA